MGAVFQFFLSCCPDRSDLWYLTEDDLSILSQLLRVRRRRGHRLGEEHPFNSFSVAARDGLPLQGVQEEAAFNSFSVAAVGFVSCLLIRLSLSREKLAKQPRTIHLRLRGFWPSRRVDS